jgi:hypothetical protein
MALTVKERQALRETHVLRSAMTYHSDGTERLLVQYCDGCISEEWPCPVLRLLDDFEALEAQVNELLVRWYSLDEALRTAVSRTNDNIRSSRYSVGVMSE